MVSERPEGPHRKDDGKLPLFTPHDSPFRPRYDIQAVSIHLYVNYLYTILKELDVPSHGSRAGSNQFLH